VVSKSRPVALTSVYEEVSAFFAGSEDGSLYLAARSDARDTASRSLTAAASATDARRRAEVRERLEGHVGPVTGVHAHPGAAGGLGAECGDLVLSSSFDWTVKLWSSKVRDRERGELLTDCGYSVWGARLTQWGLPPDNRRGRAGRSCHARASTIS
jgi:hypothetical protein